MPCCKCIEYKWSDPLPVVLVDEDGKEYCILHAPVGHPSKDMDAFNRAITERVSACSDRKVCQLSGVIFPEDFSFSRSGFENISSEIDFSHAVFYGDVDGSNCTFWGSLKFCKTEFKKNIAVKNCVFEQSLLSDSAVFECGAVFEKVTFKSIARFNKSKFLNLVVLVGCRLDQGIGFVGCIFENSLLCRVTKFFISSSFSHCEFAKSVTFRGCLLSGSTSFDNSIATEKFLIKSTQVDGKVSFSKTTFLGLTDFSGVTFKGSAVFLEAVFNKRVDFGVSKIQNYSDYFFRLTADSNNPVYFEEKAVFSYCTFRDELYFDKTIFKKTAEFKNARFFANTIFNNACFHSDVCFDGAIISKIMSLWNDNVTQLPSDGEISFKGSIIVEHVKISQAKLNQFDMRDVDLSKFYFYLCEWEKDRDGISCVFKNSHQVLDDYKKQEIVYRALKKAAIDNSDHIMASDWHYQEMVSCRNKLKYSDCRSVDENFLMFCLWVYGLISGYGERPIRAFACFAYLYIFLFLSLFVSKLFALNMPPWEMPCAAFYDVISALFKMPLYILPTRWDENILYYFALTLSRVVFPIQIALFTLSLRNRLRR